MSEPTYFVTEAVIRNLKKQAERRLKGVRSAHMSEAVAAALGFRTHAALRSSLAGRKSTEASKPSNRRAIERLHQLGYNPSEDLRLLPELDRSYSPFSTFPLNSNRGVRWCGWRNLMIAAINAGMEQGLFGLSPGEDWWAGADPQNNGGVEGQYRFTFDGDLPAVVSVSAVAGDELSIHVLLAPRNDQVEAHLSAGLEDGAAFAQGWLERRLGAWLMDGGEAYSCKRALQARLAAVDVKPLGYADQGSFIG